MKLHELFKDVADISLPDCEVSLLTDDSRKVCKGSVFVCIAGEKFDGHSVASQAVEKGAAAVVCERDMGIVNQIKVKDTREAYGELCAAWFNHPERRVKMIGVTGTNGKTTITNVVKHVLMKNGHKTGLIGTIQNEIGDEIVHTDNTTPFTFDFMELLNRMADAGCEYVVMEVSSFGLVQKRIGTAHFETALFTNLTQDHLDYHKTMEDYYQAKKLLFEKCDTAICNMDDDYGKRLYSEISCSKYTYSSSQKADYYADVIKIKPNETSFWFCSNGKCHNVTMKMTGKFNVSNMTGVIAICLSLGMPIEDIIPPISEYPGVRGRCEVIPTGKNFTVICDYAHTPDALENILSNVKEYTDGRLICLFGCGGNRDKTKRPKMAKAAAKYADMLIITSDNPRDEEPESIIDDIVEGLDNTDIEYERIPDRIEAIYHAVKIAGKGDVIVLAGKGHEDYQVLKNNVHIHLDEREVVREGLKLIEY